MRVTILHQTVEVDAGEDEKDVLQQAESVGDALRRLGHTVATTEAALNLEQTRLDLLATDPDCVFYLVESLDGTDSLAHLPAFLLETMQIPYTGAPAAALVLSNHKTRAKRAMALSGLPTPFWLEGTRAARRQETLDRPSPHFPSTFIVKPIEEHASLGMTDDCVVRAGSEAELLGVLEERSACTDRACFAEAFIDGREFNLALLGGPLGPIVLPPAEIDFDAFPAGKPRIVGYDAKWASGSFEYENTPRRFLCMKDADEAELGRRLIDLASRCWEAFGLRGYARVDFRVDRSGRPWILEVNANPCLSPDAGFAAALQEAGISTDEAVRAILADVART